MYFDLLYFSQLTIDRNFRLLKNIQRGLSWTKIFCRLENDGVFDSSDQQIARCFQHSWGWCYSFTTNCCRWISSKPCFRNCKEIAEIATLIMVNSCFLSIFAVSIEFRKEFGHRISRRTFNFASRNWNSDKTTFDHAANPLPKRW